MTTLKMPDKQIPGGNQFYDPATGYRCRPYASVSEIVNGVISARKGNPGVTIQHHLSTDPAEVRVEVLHYLAEVCRAKGWNDYIQTGGRAEAAASPPPPPTRPPASAAQKLASVAGGAKVLVKWLASGAEAVPQELANARANVCATCPLNKSGDFTEFFTVPVSHAIRAALNMRKSWKLETPYDAQLNVCEACLCPVALKVHLPINRIMADLPEDNFKRLHPLCWIQKESAKQ
jgi:hypothetical protein